MVNRILAVVLVLICIGLGIGLVTVRNRAADEKEKDTLSIQDYSNKWVTASNDLEQKKQDAANLFKDLEVQKRALSELTNDYSKVSLNLSQTKADLDKTSATLKTTQDEIVKRDAKITELESQNQVLDKQALDLSTSITNLTTQIADTEKKLSASEGDRDFLTKELKRLMAEKAELERQFNDITVLRAQVAKLKDEMNIARRIQWIRQGLFAGNDTKGAQKLMQHPDVQPLQAQTRAAKPAYDLNVEVSADGSVKVIPPINTKPPETNQPVAK